jgi:PleD family two-component response regulator
MKGEEQVGNETLPKPRILLIDDEVWIREFLSEVLQDEGYEIEAIGDNAESLERIDHGPYDLIITDINMPHVNGFQVLKRAKAQSYRPEVLLITGQGSTESAVRAVKYGAFDYLVKPIDSTRIGVTIEQALERGRLKAEIYRLQTLQGKKKEKEIPGEHLLFFDMVTGLPNRTLFNDRLELGIIRQRQKGEFLAVLLMDIDGFSRIGTPAVFAPR